MRTVVLGPRPPELEAVLERRRQLGQDLYDEVWEGVYHMSPAPHPSHGATLGEIVAALRAPAQAAGLRDLGPFNLGTSDDYRVPDYGYVTVVPPDTFVASAPIVVEVVSPDDETFDKFAFYARHGIDEIFVAEPLHRRVRIYARRGDRYDEVDTSPLLAVSAADLINAIAWP